jgi:CRISPR-associated protein Cas2
MQLGKPQWVALKARLLSEIDPDKDSLRVYFIEQDAKKRIEHYGVARSVDVVEDTLVL